MTNYKTQMKKSNFSVEIYTESLVNPSEVKGVYDVNITTAKKHARKNLSEHSTSLRMCIIDEINGIRYEYNMNKNRFNKGVYI